MEEILYIGDVVVIKAVTPFAEYRTTKVTIHENNFPTIAAIMDEPEKTFSYIRLPLDDNKVVIIPSGLLPYTSFEFTLYRNGKRKSTKKSATKTGLKERLTDTATILDDKDVTF